MARHLLKMHDFWTVQSKDVVKQKHLIDGSGSAQQTSLLVKVAATHAGIINGNMRFYRPDRMQDGCHTWMPSNGTFARPILIGHDEKGEVVGRVAEAKYIDLSYKYKHEFQTLRDSVFYASDAKRKSDMFKTIDLIVDTLMKKDDYQGLGYIELGLKVTNPEAVSKVLRDEYLTVSVGFTTDSAICSICHTDWAVDDKCDHRPGEKVDGKPMFLISGSMNFEEVSFVNFPADPFAGVISKDKLADSLARMKPFFLGLPMRQQAAITQTSGLKLSDSLYDADISIVEGSMAEQTVDPKAPVVETDTREEIEAALATGAACDPVEGCAPNLDELPEADRAYFEDEEGLYEEMIIELDAAVAEGELTQDSIADAKLSSEKRKSLSKGTFCGPNRSFPVPDCAHVTAARRLIGRAKVSEETKKRILSCVSGKAKTLKCSVGKKDTQETTPSVTDVIQGIFAKVEFKDGKTGDKALKALNGLDDMYRGLDDDEAKSLVRGATSQLVETWYADSYLNYIKSRLEEKDHVVLTKADAAAKDAEIASLQSTVTAKEADAKTARDQASAMLSTYKRALATQIVIGKMAAGAEGFKGLATDQVQAKIDELAKRHVTSLKDTVADLLSELKFTEMVAPAVRDEKPTENSITTVTDNTQVAEPAAPTVKTEDAGAEKEAALQKAKLLAMTDSERRMYLAKQKYTEVANKTRK